MKVNGSSSNIVNGTIDSRMNLAASTYQYTASLWIKTLPGIASSTTFNSSLSFFSLNNSFHLWFSDANNVRLLINATS